MPELPEVQTITMDLDELTTGRIILEVAVIYDRIVASETSRFSQLLIGAAIKKVSRLGKWILFNLNGPAGPTFLLTHLKMTGQFVLGPWSMADSWPPHIQAAFLLDPPLAAGPALLYYDIRKFGRLRAFDSAELATFLTELKLGPDPLTVLPEEFHRRVTAKKGRLKGVLLDQTIVAGFGNIYVDESLFAARLSPLRSASSLTRAETDRLLIEARRIFVTAIRERGSTTSNYHGLKGGGTYQLQHQVYGRAGNSCPVCGAVITRFIVGGRSTHICLICQGGKQ